MVTTAAPFDFSAVANSATEADLPATGAGRPRKYGEHNPFTDVLAASYEAFKAGENPGRQVTLPGRNVAEATYLIRHASDDLGVGARIVLKNGKGETVDAKAAKESRGNITILFGAKNRKQSKESASNAAEGEPTDEA